MRTEKERKKCAKITLEREGEKIGLFRGNGILLKAYVYIEVYKDIHKKNKDDLDVLKSKIKELQEELEKSCLNDISGIDEKKYHEREKEAIKNRLALTNLSYEDETDKNLFLSELWMHLERYKLGRNWSNLVRLAEDVRLRDSSDEDFTNDLSAALSGELNAAYTKYRNNKLSRNRYRQEIIRQQRAEQVNDTLVTLCKTQKQCKV